jgi:hypothetical protein
MCRELKTESCLALACMSPSASEPGSPRANPEKQVTPERRFSMNRFVIFTILIVLVSLASLSQADVPKLINYQGMLTDDGTPLTDTLDITFKIFNDSLSVSPTDKRWEETHSDVSVIDGLFNVMLGSVSALNLDFSEDYWLDITVGGEHQPDRLRLVSVGYAFTASTAGDADKVDGLDASPTATANYLYPLDGSGKIPNARLYTGPGNGLNADLLDGQHASDFLSGGADYGRSGVAVNLYEETSTLTSKYVNVTGPDSVRGSNASYPMLLVNNYDGNYSLSVGCYRSWPSPIYGTHSFVQNPSSGMAIGGYFETSGAGTGYHIGALSESIGSSTTYTDGISSYSTNNSSGEATAGYFKANDSGTGAHYGVYAESHSASLFPNHCVGVYGSAENTSSGWAVGGSFYASNSGTGPHYGVWADAYGDESTDAVTVVDAFGQNTTSADVCAGHFEASSSGTGTHYGVYGSEAAGGSGAAVYAAGDIGSSGGTYSVLKTSKGHRLLSGIESPEIWFEDFGEGQLTNGRAHIELDPLFLETVTINAQHPMKVFVQVEDENCRGTAVKRGTTGFDVIELNGGMSSSSFSYRVVAKRKGYETERLRETDVGYDDPTLYPELREEMERRHEERKIQHELRAEKRRQEEERMKEDRR